MRSDEVHRIMRKQSPKENISQGISTLLLSKRVSCLKSLLLKECLRLASKFMNLREKMRFRAPVTSIVVKPSPILFLPRDHRWNGITHHKTTQKIWQKWHKSNGVFSQFKTKSFYIESGARFRCFSSFFEQMLLWLSEASNLKREAHA